MSQRTILHVPESHPSPRPPRTGTKAPEGALAGVGMCVVLIGATGWLAGIGVLSIPGIDQLTKEGPGLAVLCGIVVGATVGGITGYLVGGQMRDVPSGKPTPPVPAENKRSISTT